MKRIYYILTLIIFILGFHQAQAQTYKLNGRNDGKIIKTCSGTFTDDRGADTNYSKNQHRIITFKSNSPNSKISIYFSEFNLSWVLFWGNPNYDYMKIYQGPDTLSSVVHNTDRNTDYFTQYDLQGKTITPDASNTSGCITFKFVAKYWGDSGPGWNATISCEPIISCQTIKANITNFIKHTPNGDVTLPVKQFSETISGNTYNYNTIDICEGDSIDIIASPKFPENNQGYAQSIDSCTYHWYFGVGDTITHSTNTVGFRAVRANGYNVNLLVEDQNHCTGLNDSTRIRIAAAPKFIDKKLTICEGDTASLAIKPFNLLDRDTIEHSYFGQQTFIPDGGNCGGTNGCYESPVTFTHFPAGSTVKSGADIQSVCLNIEHSAIQDLKLALICPNGQQTVLKYHSQNNNTIYEQGESNNEFRIYLGQPNLNDATTDVCDSSQNPMGDCWQYCWSNQYLTNSRGVFNQNCTDRYLLPGNNFKTADSTHVSLQSGYFQTPIQDLDYSTNATITTQTTWWGQHYYTYTGHTLNETSVVDLNGFDKLIGCPLNGEWKIQVCDVYATDNGWVCSWDMNVANATLVDWNYKVPIVSTAWNSPFDSIRTDTTCLIIPPADTSGTFTFNTHILDEFGCVWDSLQTLTIVKLPDKNLQDTTYACSGNPVQLDAGNAGTGYSYLWKPTNKTTQTIDTRQLLAGTSKDYIVTTTHSQAGIQCKSSDTTKVIAIYPTTNEYNGTACQGKRYIENGFDTIFNTTAGSPFTIIDTIKSIKTHCDSIINILHLTVNPKISQEITATICEGKTYNENGFNETGVVGSTTTYTHTDPSKVTGCDSTTTLRLTVNPKISQEITATICEGKTYNENGFNETGVVGSTTTYTHTDPSKVTGCDSTTTLRLTVNPKISQEITATICEGQDI
ncbi:MAG: proprotein convertase P-domain-containing protein [Bacteroidales bacterium]|jgi:subtilisin-like proprotein convertase family protein/predicted RNA binding protein YcfA (HicA-like mRNA interferase family)|nr:proprotein convertase P-domain-containing protein [Bacteroidales bacterium]